MVKPMFHGMEHLTKEEQHEIHCKAVQDCKPISKSLDCWQAALQQQRDKWLLEGKITKEEYERLNAIGKE
jgi:hypothetical protein|tara:strand:- start:1309 stop:1518 length:210 start_codon:yes stop_codon:yes gene_type:complete